MQKVTRFKCDVCGNEYTDADDAKACEARCKCKYKCKYMWHCVRIGPYKGTFEYSVLPVSSDVEKPEVEMLAGEDFEGYDRITFNIIVPVNDVWTEDLVRKRLAASVRKWLACITDKLHEFETMQ